MISTLTYIIATIVKPPHTVKPSIAWHSKRLPLFS